MRNYRNLTRFLHIALALSGIFALSAGIERDFWTVEDLVEVA